MTDQGFDFSVDRKNLYREEYYTDLKVATVRKLTPVKADGSVDKSRKTLYVGQANLMSEAGPLPVSTMIEATNLRQALKKYPEAMQLAMDKLSEELKKYEQEQQSSLMTPGSQDESRIIVPGR